METRNVCIFRVWRSDEGSRIQVDPPALRVPLNEYTRLIFHNFTEDNARVRFDPVEAESRYAHVIHEMRPSGIRRFDLSVPKDEERCVTIRPTGQGVFEYRVDVNGEPGKGYCNPPLIPYPGGGNT